MILFNEIVEVLHLSQFTAFRKVSCCLEFLERFGVRCVFVHIDDAWLARMGSCKRFEQERFGSCRVSGRAKKEIEGVAARVNGTIETHPLLFDFDIRLVNTPGVRRGHQVGATTLIKLRRIALDPAVDRGMVHLQPTFQHHFFEVPIAERIAQIPPDATSE